MYSTSHITYRKLVIGALRERERLHILEVTGNLLRTIEKMQHVLFVMCWSTVRDPSAFFVRDNIDR